MLRNTAVWVDPRAVPRDRHRPALRDPHRPGPGRGVRQGADLPADGDLHGRRRHHLEVRLRVPADVPARRSACSTRSSRRSASRPSSSSSTPRSTPCMLIVVMVWIQAGFAMTVLSAAIKAIPDDIIEAAKLDGVQGFKMFRFVTLPSIRPALVVVLTTIGIGTLKVFDIVRTMTGGQFDTSVVANEFYNQSFRYNAARAWAPRSRCCCSSSSSRSSSTTSSRCARRPEHEHPPAGRHARVRQRRRDGGRVSRDGSARRAQEVACRRRGPGRHLALGLGRRDRHRGALDDADLRPARHLVPRPDERSTRTGWWTVFTDPGVLTLENYREALAPGTLGRAWRSTSSTRSSSRSRGAPAAVPGLARGLRVRVDAFPGRDTLFVAVFALQIVPLQVALIPLLDIYVNTLGIGATPTGACGCRTRSSRCHWRSS